MYAITKEFAFSASHILRGLREGHQCGRLHGHNYTCLVELESPTLDRIGFVRDYGDLADIKHYIDTVLDHRHLNDAMTENPTAEALAFLIYTTFIDTFPELASIGISETPKTWAFYRADRA